MLAGTGLCDDAGLSEFLRQQRLAEHVIDLVRTRVVEVLTLKEHAHATQVSREAGCLGQQGRATGVVEEQVAQTVLEGLVAPQAFPRGLDLFERTHEGLGDKTASEVTEVRSLSKVLGVHHCPS